MIDVLVTCFPHGPDLTLFPQVRGYYLAKHLARSGLRAEFRQLPLPGFRCRVLICCGYQYEMELFERHLAAPLAEIQAGRLYCLTDSSLRGRGDHFSREYCEWFAARGGVLCQMTSDALEPYEQWIGVGVDAEIVRPAPDRIRDRVLFDFPRSSSIDPASTFDVEVLDRIRESLPGLRLVGSGGADSSVRDAFDEWVTYGADHPAYVAAAFGRTIAVVPGCDESLGLALAEAEVAGACVVSSAYQVKEQILVREAAVGYEANNARSLAGALHTATTRDWRRIRAEASARFDFGRVAARTRAAVGV